MRNCFLSSSQCKWYNSNCIFEYVSTSFPTIKPASQPVLAQHELVLERLVSIIPK